MGGGSDRADDTADAEGGRRGVGAAAALRVGGVVATGLAKAEGNRDAACGTGGSTRNSEPTDDCSSCDAACAGTSACVRGASGLRIGARGPAKYEAPSSATPMVTSAIAMGRLTAR